MKKLLIFFILSIIAVFAYPQYIEHSTDEIFHDLYNWELQRIDVWEYDKIPLRYELSFNDMVFPLKKTYVTSNFGYRRQFSRQHQGIDLKAMVGDTVYASFNGRVRISQYNKGGYGNYIVIRHFGGLETLYAHLSKSLVKKNDDIKAGDPIGLSGNTGRSTGPHLHFEIRFCGIALNPEKIADFENNLVLAKNYTFEKKRRR